MSLGARVFCKQNFKYDVKPKATITEELIVYGYNHEADRDLEILIPPLVIMVILSYYANIDYFETYAEDMEISGQFQNIITNLSKGCHTGYGSALIDLKENPSLIYEWSFKMISIGSYVCIAIDSTFDCLNEYIFADFDDPTSNQDRRCYDMHCQGAYYSQLNGSWMLKSDHIYLREGFSKDDNVTLRLNSKTKLISFVKNGKDFGFVNKFTVDTEKKYRIAVFMYDENDKVELTEFKSYSIQ